MAYPIGTYRFKIETQGFEISKNKGTWGFFLEGVPTGFVDPLTNEETPVDKQYTRKMTWWLPKNKPEMADRAIEDLKRIGFDGESFSELDPANGPQFSFYGKEIWVSCSHERVGENTYDRFELPYAGKKSEPTSSSPEISKKLDALFGKKPSAARKSAAATTVAEGKETPPDDEIPF